LKTHLVTLTLGEVFEKTRLVTLQQNSSPPFLHNNRKLIFADRKWRNSSNEQQ
jgi:hypothetical protein